MSTSRQSGPDCPGRCDLGRGVCRGCGRTLEQITAWSGLSDDARQAVLDSIGTCPACGQPSTADAGPLCLCPHCGVRCCEGVV